MTSLRKEYNINTETERGHFGVTWQTEHKHLPYTRSELSTERRKHYNDLGYLSNSAIKNSVEEYNEPTMPLWATDMGRVFGLFDQSLKFIRLSQYDVIPPHDVSVTDYCIENRADPDDIMIGILMLEDWKPGHLLEIDGTPHTNWKQGDWFKFFANTSSTHTHPKGWK